MKQNLNQIRARYALEFARDPQNNVVGANGGEVIKKIPPAIMNDGILATMAFAMDPKNKGWKEVFDGIALYLSSREVQFIPYDQNNTELLLDYLTDSETSSDTLRLVTNEAMAWLEFARRFVVRNGGRAQANLRPQNPPLNPRPPASGIVINVSR